MHLQYVQPNYYIPLWQFSASVKRRHVVLKLKAPAQKKKIPSAWYGHFTEPHGPRHTTEMRLYTKLQLPWRQLVLRGQFISSTLFTNSYKPLFNSVPKLIISLKISDRSEKYRYQMKRKSCRRYYQFGNRSFLKGTNFQRRKKMGEDHENYDMIGGFVKRK